MYPAGYCLKKQLAPLHCARTTTAAIVNPPFQSLTGSWCLLIALLFCHIFPARLRTLCRARRQAGSHGIKANSSVTKQSHGSCAAGKEKRGTSGLFVGGGGVLSTLQTHQSRYYILHPPSPTLAPHSHGGTYTSRTSKAPHATKQEGEKSRKKEAPVLIGDLLAKWHTRIFMPAHK